MYLFWDQFLNSTLQVSWLEEKKTEPFDELESPSFKNLNFFIGSILVSTPYVSQSCDFGSL